MRKLIANPTYAIVVLIVHSVMALALYVSFGHIIAASASLGLFGFQAYTAPLFIDGFMILGRIGRSHKFAPETRKVGKWIQIGATLVSLSANVYAGHTAGERIYGALVVAGFILAELYAEKLRPVELADETAAKARRSAAGRKAAATRKANALALAQAEANRPKRGRPRKLTAVAA